MRYPLPHVPPGRLVCFPESLPAPASPLNRTWIPRHRAPVAGDLKRMAQEREREELTLPLEQAPKEQLSLKVLSSEQSWRVSGAQACTAFFSLML